MRTLPSQGDCTFSRLYPPRTPKLNSIVEINFIKIATFQKKHTNNKKASHGEERNQSPGLLKYISENVLFSTTNYEKSKKHKL